MKTVYNSLLILAFLFFAQVYGQKPLIELAFTATYYGQYAPLDSIFIENLTQGSDTTLYAPDTVLVWDYTVNTGGNGLFPEEGYTVFQNRPNPFTGETMIEVYLPEEDHLKLSVHDILGREVALFESALSRGLHCFTFYPGRVEQFVLSAACRQGVKAIKMVCLGELRGGSGRLMYNGIVKDQAQHKSSREETGAGFSSWAQLRFTGYAKTPAGVAGSGAIADVPVSDTTYTFNILEGLPCVGTPLVAYEGQTYTTVQIGTQCWLKENLNVGTMVPGIFSQTDNDTIEKYCYYNDDDNCAEYGGLYQWDEIMQYETGAGMRGICPPGWHVPTDAAWCTLTKYIDPSIDCYAIGNSGSNFGTKLKSTTGWAGSGNGTNTSGFTALPAGYRTNIGSFGGLSFYADFWSSTKGGPVYWYRSLVYNDNGIFRYHYDKTAGMSVRCLKDPEPYTWTCGDTILDARNGKMYNTVEIGGQCWMAENLDVGTMIPGDGQQTNNDIIEKYCFNNGIEYCAVYGGLYQWNEMMQYTTQPGTQGICPPGGGWHIPTDNDWTILTDFLGGLYFAGGHLKETDTTHWLSPNTGASNSTSFTALPGGYRDSNCFFYYLAYSGDFWSSTESGSNGTWYRRLYYHDANIHLFFSTLNHGRSVRCLQD
jgi:uncharacterized protein (TIGR02145 family)